LYFYGEPPPGTIILRAGRSSLETPTNSDSLEPRPSSMFDKERKIYPFNL